jgi:hypothetical protein
VRVTQNSNTSDRIISDVITGKGGGLVCSSSSVPIADSLSALSQISVLHGPPGTGKTLTAESLAEHLHRPLYMVSFSELSTTSNDLEPALKRILSVRAAMSRDSAHWLILCSLQLRGMPFCSSTRQTYVWLKRVERWYSLFARCSSSSAACTR